MTSCSAHSPRCSPDSRNAHSEPEVGASPAASMKTLSVNRAETLCLLKRLGGRGGPFETLTDSREPPLSWGLFPKLRVGSFVGLVDRGIGAASHWTVRAPVHC